MAKKVDATAPEDHRVYAFKDGRTEVLAQNGVLGNKEGSTRTCQFGQPTGIFVEKASIYVTDAQVGSVKLIVDLEPTVQFLQCLGNIFQAFRNHEKGQRVERAPLQTGIQALEMANDYLRTATHAVQEDVGKGVTNGPEGFIQVIV